LATIPKIKKPLKDQRFIFDQKLLEKIFKIFLFEDDVMSFAGLLLQRCHALLLHLKQTDST